MLLIFLGKLLTKKKKKSCKCVLYPVLLIYSGSSAAQAGLELRVTESNLLPPPEGSTLS